MELLTLLSIIPNDVSFTLCDCDSGKKIESYNSNYFLEISEARCYTVDFITPETNMLMIFVKEKD